MRVSMMAGITAEIARNASLSMSAAVATLGFQWLVKHLYYRYWYSSLSGVYSARCISQDIPGEDDITVQHKGGRILTMECNPNAGGWVNSITMSPDIKDYGQGIYQYVDKDDCGTHSIQINRDKKIIYMIGVNTSHAKDTKFSHILTRKPQPKIAKKKIY